MRIQILLFCLVYRACTDTHLGIIEPEDSEAAVWDVPGSEFDWSVPLSPPNISLPSAADFLPLNASGVNNASGAFDSAEGIVSMNFDESAGLIDLGFQKQIMDMKSQFDSFVDRLAGLENSTWTFVAFVTLMPLRCSAVDKVASLFDQAMATTNPSAGIVSLAQRLGASPCNGDGVCPCLDSKRRKHTTRVLELRFRSGSANVVYPLKEDFPYKVDIRQSPS
jgi:hypothetical protein